MKVNLRSTIHQIILFCRLHFVYSTSNVDEPVLTGWIMQGGVLTVIPFWEGTIIQTRSKRISVITGNCNPNHNFDSGFGPCNSTMEQTIIYYGLNASQNQNYVDCFGLQFCPTRNAVCSKFE